MFCPCSSWLSRAEPSQASPANCIPGRAELRSHHSFMQTGRAELSQAGSSRLKAAAASARRPPSAVRRPPSAARRPPPAAAHGAGYSGRLLCRWGSASPPVIWRPSVEWNVAACGGRLRPLRAVTPLAVPRPFSSSAGPINSSRRRDGGTHRDRAAWQRPGL